MNEKKLSEDEKLEAVGRILDAAGCIPESKLGNIIAEYVAIALDLSETTIGSDLDFQRTRLEKNTQRLKDVITKTRDGSIDEPVASPQIHAGGTGKE